MVSLLSLANLVLQDGKTCWFERACKLTRIHCLVCAFYAKVASEHLKTVQPSEKGVLIQFVMLFWVG